MGRNILVDARIGGGSTAEIIHGSILLEPTTLRREGEAVIFPAPTEVGIGGGFAVLKDVAPSPDGPEPEWAYRVTVRDARSSRAWSELVGVPAGDGAISYTDLPRFSTTTPAGLSPEQMQSWADTAQQGAVDAQAAAEQAMAPTDMTVASLLGTPGSATALAFEAAIEPVRDQLATKADSAAAATLDELITTIGIDPSTIGHYLISAPFPLRIAQMSLICDTAIPASDANFLTVELFRTRAGAQASMGAIKTTKLTGGEGFAVHTPWTFDAVPFTESRRLLDTLDGLRVQITRTGTVILPPRFLVTVRYQPL